MKELEHLMDLAFKTPLYAELYHSKGLKKSDISCIDDLTKLPTISKKDIIADFRKAIGKPEDVFKYHTTSGTSGTPTIVAFTKNDWDLYVRQNAKCLQLIGATKRDIFYNSTPYGMFFAGMVLHDASIALGGTVIPAGNLHTTQAHVNLIETFHPTVFVGIPQFLLKLGKTLNNQGIDPRELSFKRAYCLGEPLPEEKRKLIEEIWDIPVFCGYGLSECGAGAECSEKIGYHWPIEDILVEVLDEKNGHGELTYTTLKKTGTLAIRFRSRDLGYVHEEKCACGDPSPVISYIEARLDDLVKVKGTLLSPFAIDSALYSVQHVDNYLCVIDEKDGLDVVKIYIEGDNIDITGVKRAVSAITFVSPTSVDIVPKDDIPVIGRKSNRFIDLRKHTPYEKLVREFMNRNLI